ncbi:MAG: copper resistance D family protein [Gemmatimonadales bacterium]
MSEGLLALYAVVRGLIYIALLLLVGTQVVGWLLRPLDHDFAPRDSPRRRLERVPPAALIGLLLAILARGLLQLDSLLDPGDHITFDLVRNALLTGSWGHAWLLQSLAVAVTLILVAFVRPRMPDVLVVVLVAAMLCGQTGMGHAAGDPWPSLSGRVVDLLHLVGAGIWLGTLAVLMIALLPLVNHSAHIPHLASVIHRYSIFARIGVVLVVASGVTAALVYSGASVRMLLESTWGRLLLFKLGCMAGVMALGWYNWRVVTPALKAGVPGCERKLRRAIIAELSLTIAMLAITTVLVATALPGEGS